MENDILFTDSPFANFSRRTFLGVLLTAIIAAILTLILTIAIDKVVLQPAMCIGSDTATCTQSSQVAFHIASIISAIVAVVLLVQASVYRPLLIGIAVTASLWNIYGAFLGVTQWPIQLLLLILINSLAYFAFTWILRTYNMTIALISTAALVVLTLLVTSL